jgi:hypothetical protein
MQVLRQKKIAYFLTLVLFFTGFSWPVCVLGSAAIRDSTVSSDRIMIGTFANDATFRTDYYFTQGISVNVIHPVFSKSPVNKILLKASGATNSYYGLKVIYNGFTPLKILDPNIRYGDRPYAAYIYSTHYRVSNNQVKKQRFTSGFDLGFMGPGARAGEFQSKVHQWLHSPPPKGWQHQLQTDVVLGYQAAYEKQLLPAYRALELIGAVRASLGTLNTFGAGELLLRTGKMNGYFQNLGIASRPNRQNLQRFQFYAQGRLTGQLVGYNATLQGGLLNKHNAYTLDASQISRTVLQRSAGLVCAYQGISFESSVVWISREFDHARRHKWMHFDLRFVF